MSFKFDKNAINKIMKEAEGNINKDIPINSYEDIDRVIEEYGENNVEISWDKISEKTDIPEWFTEKYKKYLK